MMTSNKSLNVAAWRSAVTLTKVVSVKWWIKTLLVRIKDNEKEEVETVSIKTISRKSD